MFEIEMLAGDKHQLSMTLTWTKTFCELFIDQSIPLAITLVFIFLLRSGRPIFSMRNGKIYSLSHLVVCITCIGMSSVPLLHLSPGLRSETWKMLPTQSFIKPWSMVAPYHFSNGYGLFRRMTGVGANDGRYNHRALGWGGLPPSIVERPEIILEGRLSNSGEIREINFRWKPGDVSRRPRQVAPHQPRVSFSFLMCDCKLKFEFKNSACLLDHCTHK